MLDMTATPRSRPGIAAPGGEKVPGPPPPIKSRGIAELGPRCRGPDAADVGVGASQQHRTPRGVLQACRRPGDSDSLSVRRKFPATTPVKTL